jgi:hypothetical protein
MNDECKINFNCLLPAAGKPQEASDDSSQLDKTACTFNRNGNLTSIIVSSLDRKEEETDIGP